MSGRRVAVVTGGGRGIGAALAEELARTGAHVVTVDPLVSLEGRSETDLLVEPTTADRIVAAGGSAEASAASVTDPAQIDRLLADLVDEHGRLDVLVNVAGITRPTSLTTGSDEDWRAVLEVHLDGYLHVLRAALGHMAAAGTGRILGVTSGAGWRPGDAGAYSCAKRAVAALTWELGAVAPSGVSVNALSPIAMTRMVTAALSARAGRSTTGPTSGGLRLGTGMPTPEQVAPVAAALVRDESDWLRGRVVFCAGTEVAAVDPPRLVEAVGVSDPETRVAVLDQVVSGAFVPAHQRQDTTGGANQRFDVPEPDGTATGAGARIAVISGGTGTPAAAILAALRARGVEQAVPVDAGVVARPTEAAAVLAELDASAGPLDAVVVLVGRPPTNIDEDDWRGVLDSHEGLSERIRTDAAWVRAAAELAVGQGRDLRLVSVIPADSSGGRSRAQAAAQLARAAGGATSRRMTAAVVEFRDGSDGPLADLVGHLCVHPDAVGLDGAHLLAEDGWVGIYRHPRAGSSVVIGEAGVPQWFDPALRLALGEAGDR